MTSTSRQAVAARRRRVLARLLTVAPTQTKGFTEEELSDPQILAKLAEILNHPDNDHVEECTNYLRATFAEMRSRVGEIRALRAEYADYYASRP